MKRYVKLLIIITGVLMTCLFSACTSKTEETPYETQLSIKVLVEQENYKIYLNGKETDFRDITREVDLGFGVLDKTMISNVSIDNESKRIDYFNNIGQQVRTLSKEAGYAILLNGNDVQLDNIDLSEYKVFINYDDKTITLTEK